jgi:hypothetical protein
MTVSLAPPEKRDQTTKRAPVQKPAPVSGGLPGFFQVIRQPRPKSVQEQILSQFRSESGFSVV